jgi:hypothetical protein
VRRNDVNLTAEPANGCRSSRRARLVDRWRFLRACLAVAVGATLLVAGGAAEAHPEFSPSAINRYCKLTLVEPQTVRLAYTVMIGAEPALAARKQADANADGRVDDDESRALAARVRGAVEAGLTVELDGARVSPPFETPSVGLAGAEVAPSPLSVDLVARIPVGGDGPHRLRVEDSVELTPFGEAEVRVEESPSVRLLAAARGRELPANDAEAKPPKELRWIWSGPPRSALEDRSVSLRFVANASASADAPRRGALVGAVGGGIVLIVLGVGALVVRRTRRRAASQRSMNG